MEPGLYTIALACPQRSRISATLSLPFITVHPAPPLLEEPGRAYLSTLSDSPLIQTGDETAYLRISGGNARLLLTIYAARNASARPEVIIRQATPFAAPPPDAAAAQEGDVPSLPLTLLAHVERIGDVSVPGGRWAGTPGGKAALEGFSITPTAGLQPTDIEYQALLGVDWRTPWASSGAFCGSRGLSLPLLGVAIRLSATAAETHSVTYWGSFGGTEVGPVADGALCTAESGALEALRVTVTAKGSS